MAKRLIDANQMLENIELLARHEDTFRQSVILGVAEIIRNAATVDAVEVVRCKQCRFFRITEFSKMTAGRGFCTKIECGVKQDDFCSYCERKEKEGEAWQSILRWWR